MGFTWNQRLLYKRNKNQIPHHGGPKKEKASQFSSLILQVATRLDYFTLSVSMCLKPLSSTPDHIHLVGREAA